LGLTIARRIIAAHGGSVRATNRPEGGLEIEVELPVVTCRPQSQGVAQSQPA
jgi:signal transduction histidine kinase